MKNWTLAKSKTTPLDQYMNFIKEEKRQEIFCAYIVRLLTHIVSGIGVCGKTAESVSACDNGKRLGRGEICRRGIELQL